LKILENVQKSKSHLHDEQHCSPGEPATIFEMSKSGLRRRWENGAQGMVAP
jgi:hypothetical protein